MNKILIDAREMEHPVPLERGIAAISTLGKDDYIYMLNRKNPIPLIKLAKERGLNTLSYEDDQNTWHILISIQDENRLKELLDV